MTTHHMTGSCLFSLRQLSSGVQTVSSISHSAQEAGINRRHDRVEEWADLPVRQLCDVGLAEETGDRGVYRVTASGRKVIAT
jgi:hypothetical protein